MKPFSPEVSPDPCPATAAHFLRTYTLFLTLLELAQGCRGSMVSNRPFITVWNADTHWCLKDHGVDVDVSVFDVVANKEQNFQGPNMTIFYREELGTYPYYTPTGEPVFGGLPQNASLVTHLAHAFQDIKAAMPEPDFSGLAVIDWEAWRPRWAFNWDSKDIYQQRSMELVRAEHPDWPETLVEAEAQDQFQEAAQAWMAGTLQLGQEELEHSLGESAAQGAAGAVLWISSEKTSTKESCQAIKAYMDSTLGPFILNVTSAALLCSEALCSGRGRCVRHPSYPEALLTLNPASFSIEPTHDGRPLSLKGTLSLKDRAQMAMKFKCRCYRGWSGEWCKKQDM
ncbi:hyaluronidase-1 isoform X1 [Rattus rattus]|uniref:hyaluronidase-1 isoform X1 n=1 Tax=Rattus rattus TaxID=10117 RepID=UPI0013F39207|nr:hyaluronidase-1 isoform X1 [Rattus rattus]